MDDDESDTDVFWCDTCKDYVDATHICYVAIVINEEEEEEEDTEEEDDQK